MVRKIAYWSSTTIVAVMLLMSLSVGVASLRMAAQPASDPRFDALAALVDEKMREYLIKKQESNEKSPNFGSWNPEGDPWARVGGRLMITSLNLLTLEVYYRYLPLYYRDAGAKADPAVMKAIGN